MRSKLSTALALAVALGMPLSASAQTTPESAPPWGAMMSTMQQMMGMMHQMMGRAGWNRDGDGDRGPGMGWRGRMGDGGPMMGGRRDDDGDRRPGMGGWGRMGDGEPMMGWRRDDEGDRRPGMGGWGRMGDRGPMMGGRRDGDGDRRPGMGGWGRMGDRGPMMGGRDGYADRGPGQWGGWRDGMPARHPDGMIAFYKAEIAITPAQEPQWQAYVTALQSQIAAMRDRAGPPQGQDLSLPDRMDARVARLSAALERAKTIATAGKALYAVLTPEQHPLADRLMAMPMMGGQP